MSDNLGLFARLYFDEDVQKPVAAALRARSFDVTSAREIGRWGFSDEAQLEYAASQDRAIVSYNIRDYQLLYRIWMQAGRDHAGILLSPQVTISNAIYRLASLLNSTTADEMRNQLLWF